MAQQEKAGTNRGPNIVFDIVDLHGAFALFELMDPVGKSFSLARARLAIAGD